MDSARWELIQSIFHEAADMPAEARSNFLDSRCSGDLDLKDEVSALLNADSEPASIFEIGVKGTAGNIIDGRSGSTPIPTHRFGAYHVTEVLGEGGMGVVYLAERDDLGSRAAVKILRDASLSPSRRERFAAEQRTLAQMEHPSIARLYDSGTLSDGTPWFVMEYVEGTPITEYCRSHQCSLRERLELFGQVCDAVQYAHQNLVIHRDLKPSNILVRTDGTVKLLDFGISKHLDSLDPSAEQTRTAVRMMTPAYASPEQMRGGAVGTHTDVYSLGVILYELLVGRLPFDLSKLSLGEAEAIVLQREPERPSAAARRMDLIDGPAEHHRDIRKGEWADLDVLIQKALSKDPTRRYQTVSALERDVDHFLRNEPLEARGESARYRVGKFVLRYRRTIALGAGTVAALIAVVTFYTLRLASARNLAVAEQAKAERIQGFTLNLLQGGDEEAGPADSLRVVTLVDRGLQQVRTLEREPATQAQLFETLGGLYQKLGNFSRADSLLTLSLNGRVKLFGPGHPDVGQSLIALGMLRDAQAEFDSAETFIRRAVALYKQANPPNPAGLQKATAALGRVISDKGDYDRAIPILREAVRLEQEQSPASTELSVVMSDLANAEFYAGNYARSDTINQNVLAIDHKLYGSTHPHIADDLMNLGAIQQEFQNFDKAEPYYRDALAITRTWYGNSNPETASALTQLGRTLVSEKKFGDAVTMLSEALQIQERVYGPVHPRVASALNELGRASQQQGNLDEAEKDFRRVVDIYKKVYNDKHYTISIALSNLAGVYKDRKNYGEAERLFDEAIRRYKIELAPDHQLMGIARVRLGETLLDDKKLAGAKQELVEGQRILMKQSSPPPVWVDRAKKGLASLAKTAE